MNLTFHSVDSDNNKVTYTTEYEYKNDEYIFLDKSVEDTKIYLKIADDLKITIKRIGNINMEIVLDQYNITIGNYKSKEGLVFELLISNTKIEINKNKLYLEYDSTIYDIKTNHKIWILFNS